MVSEQATIKSFAHSIWKQWVLGVSGGLATIAAAVAGLTQAYAEAVLLALVALGALSFAAYRSWAAEREKVISLEERLRPKLKCSVPPDDPGCVRPNTLLDGIITAADGTQQKVKITSTYFRIRVETDKTHHVESCKGRLLSVRYYDELIVSGENIDLPFAHSQEDAFSKLIYQGVPDYLDLIVVPKDKQPVIATKGFWKPSSIADEVFKRIGLYILHVAVLTPLGEAAHIRVVFDWTGNPLTSTMAQ